MPIGPGFFSAALDHPDGLGRVYLADPPDWRTVVCEVAGVERWRVQAPDLLRELWAAAAPDGRVMIAAQGGVTQELTVGEMTFTGQAFWPIYSVGCRHAGVAWNGAGFVLFAVLNDGVTLLRIDVNSGFQQRLPVAVSGGTTLGFRQLKAGLDVNGSEDEIVYSERLDGNGYLEEVVNGVIYRLPVRAGDVLIGQIGGMTGGVYLPTGERFLVCEQETRDPRLVTKGGLYLACGYLESNRAFVTTFPPFEPLPVVTPPIDPPPPPIDNPTPNFLPVVQRVFSEHSDLVEANTRESCGRLTEFIVWALAQFDRGGFGHLSKQPGENQFNGHAVDATIYRPTQQVVDVIANSGARGEWLEEAIARSDPGPARPDWNEVPKRDGNDWMPAFNPTPDDPPPPPIDPPPPPGLYPHEVFLTYAQAAGVILAPRVIGGWNDLSQDARDELFPHIKQRAIGQGDRFRARQLNPSVMDLVIGGLLDLPTFHQPTSAQPRTAPHR